MTRIAPRQNQRKFDRWELSELKFVAPNFVYCINLAIKVWHDAEIKNM